MKLKNMVLTSLLLAIGLILHQIVPPIVAGMKPDFLLAMLFVALYIDNTPKNAFLAGILAGIFSALTTGFPGGQIANPVDKMVTAFTVFFMIKAFSRLNTQLTVPVVAFIGTIISGTVFLGTALLVLGGKLPASFPVLFTTVVLPAAAVNTITTYICYNVVFSTRKFFKKA
ncbi:MAG: hypothetical protein PWQ82_1120 [Thermosediminibacterales bacterium]|nr:hypothetical protein [Thermosediminibacterales bacterium]MDK2835686.1 hypothetical protein [Thermosediminibacterales bacterium]